MDRQINHFTTSYTTRGSSRVKRFNRRRSQLPPSIKCFMRTAAGTKTRASSHGSRETPGNGWRDFVVTHTRRRHAALVEEEEEAEEEQEHSRRRLNLLTTSNGQAPA